MALKPNLQMRVDELFFFWLSSTHGQETLQNCLLKILQGNKENIGRYNEQPVRLELCDILIRKPPYILDPEKARSLHELVEDSIKQDYKREPSLDISTGCALPVSHRSGVFLHSAAYKVCCINHSSHIQKGKENVDPSSPSCLRHHHQHTRFTSSCIIPGFYFPRGNSLASGDLKSSLQKVKSAFGLLSGRANKEKFRLIVKACGLPLYWKMPVFLASGGDEVGYVTCDRFLDFWRSVIYSWHDDASRFVHILTRGTRDYILPDDFLIIMHDIINTHPGLQFLKDATEFHSRYSQTVIARIFYCVNRSWSGKITVSELRKSNFLQILAVLEEEEDINQIADYFSYEHFYVIYCKFWKLDTDHDLFIDKSDLKRHNEGALSSRIVERIFSGAVTRGSVHKKGRMSYTEFVWFLISEEDKRHPRSIEYWFRCMDLDGDGFLSMYELEYFYEEQVDRLDVLGIETLSFKDCLCQMLDIVRPKIPGKIALSDLKRCKMTPMFFDTFFNLEKYLDHEQKDPFFSQKVFENNLDQVSDWIRFAEEEYQILVAEESANEHPEELILERCNQLGNEETGWKYFPQRCSNKSVIDDDDYADSDPDY